MSKMYKKCIKFKAEVESSKEKLVGYIDSATMTSRDAEIMRDILVGMDAAISVNGSIN
jgi:hypothetical protein